MTVSFSILVFLIVVALLFDFLNGLHDAANSIATVVATRVLSPVVAVVWAAFFNFTAYFVFGTAVAKTVGAGIVSADIIDPRVIFGALCGAIAWNVITWVKGIPSSSSHALVGGLQALRDLVGERAAGHLVRLAGRALQRLVAHLLARLRVEELVRLAHEAHAVLRSRGPAGCRALAPLSSAPLGGASPPAGWSPTEGGARSGALREPRRARSGWLRALRRVQCERGSP